VLLDFKGRKRPLSRPGLYSRTLLPRRGHALARRHPPLLTNAARPDALAFRAALTRQAALSARETRRVSRLSIAGEIQSVVKG